MSTNAPDNTSTKVVSPALGLISNILFVEDDEELAVALQAGFGDDDTSNFIIEAPPSLEQAIAR